MSKTKKLYEAPAVEQMQCRVERGFAGSDANKGTEKLVNDESLQYGDSDFIFS